MHLSANGLKLLMNAEGFRDQAYQDTVGKATIGYGHRILPEESFPEKISEADAAALLENDIFYAEQAVARLVKVPLAQGQFDALVDFVFNLGATSFAHSSLLALLNAGRYDDAAAQFGRWCYAGRIEMAGLKARRAAELALWNSPPQPSPMPGNSNA